MEAGVLQEGLDEIDELPDEYKQLIYNHLQDYWSRKDNSTLYD